jgi:16S rRNA (cytidine1402-2'-O)-methyltransferase
LAAGTLHLVATPIGNLGDVTARALEVLAAVDWIAAEDTRHTRRMLAHFGIATPLFSAHAHNERVRAADIVKKLAAGTRGALVVDAGSPGISDPGALIVREVIAAGHDVRVVPGPSAVIAALSVSGLDSSTFLFAGFLPARASARDARLSALLARPETLVLYEAPHRARATLEAIARLAPGRRLAACRELTKLHEEVRRGDAAHVLAGLAAEQERGEWALVIEGAPAAGPRAAEADDARRKFVDALVATGATAVEAEERATFVLGNPRPGRAPRPGRGPRRAK